MPGLAIGDVRAAPADAARDAPCCPRHPTAVLIRGLATFGFFAVDAYVSRVLVDLRGMTLAQAGIVLTATTITWTAGSWIQAHWNDALAAPYRFVRGGMLIVAAGIATLHAGASVRPDPGVDRRADLRARGLGMGLYYSPLGLIMLREATPGEQGSASSALSLTDSLGTALGTGISGAIVAAGIRADGKPGPGPRRWRSASASRSMLLGAALAGRLQPASHGGSARALR